VLAETGAAAALSLLSMLLIGRIIGPAEAGLGAIAVSAFLLLDVLGAALFTDALVQRPRLAERTLRSALTAATLVGAAAGGLLAAAAPLLAWAAGDDRLLWLTLALAPLLPFSAFAGAASGAVLREGRYRMLAMRVLLAQPLALGAGLAAAASGLGAWAMVINQAAVTMAVFALLATLGRVPLRPALSVAALRELWPVAGPQIGTLVVALGRYRIFLIALGTLVAEAVLAQAHFAFRILDAVFLLVSQTVTRLGMPRLSALQENREALARSYGELAQLQALLGLPAAIGVALVADDLVLGLLGPDWAGTAEAARVAGLVAAGSFLHGNHFSLFVAIGRARLNLLVAVVHLVLPLLGLLLFRPGTPAGIAAAWAAPLLVVTPAVAWIVLRELDRSPAWLLRQAAPAIVATLAMVPAVLMVQRMLEGQPPLLRLVLAAGAGAAAFAVVAWAMLGRSTPAALRASPAPTV
jgi:O-antigen/teichoic acid export membrane protein